MKLPPSNLAGIAKRLNALHSAPSIATTGGSNAQCDQCDQCNDAHTDHQDRDRAGIVIEPKSRLYTHDALTLFDSISRLAGKKVQGYAQSPAEGAAAMNDKVNGHAHRAAT